METIRNYLESMFRGLPQTDKIMRAKSELLQMMEDKYTELIRSGKTENEAVGEVIQNFGNLEDLAEDLGIKDILHQTKYSDVQRRKLSFDEVTDFLAAKKRAIIMKSTAICLFIISVIFPILSDTLDISEKIGVVLMFLAIGCGVMFMCLTNTIMEPWRYIKNEPCSIDAISIDYLKNKIRDFTPTYSVLSSVGVLLCILCFIPAVIFDEFGGCFMDELGGVMLFVFVGAGVFLMVFAKSMKRAYLNLLNINEKIEFYEIGKGDNKMIENKNVKVILSAYWSVVTCIYLCVSFLTFQWHITWLIWPVAAAIHTIIKAIYAVEPSEKENKKSVEKEDE